MSTPADMNERMEGSESTPWRLILNWLSPKKQRGPMARRN